MTNAHNFFSNNPAHKEPKSIYFYPFQPRFRNERIKAVKYVISEKYSDNQSLDSHVNRYDLALVLLELS